MKHSCRSYDIPSKFLKLASSVVSEWLAELFNRCINGGVFLILSKLIASLQFLKFEIHNPHQTKDLFPLPFALSKVFENLLYIRELILF